MGWDDSYPVLFHIMDRHKGKVLQKITSSEGAWFVYHVTNAFEDEQGQIHIDFSKYANDTLITQGMYLQNLIDHPEYYVPTYEQARLTRCVLDPKAGTESCTQVIDKT